MESNYYIFNLIFLIFTVSIRGETIWPDKRRYKGGYLDDKKHGYGVFEWANNKKYEG